ncbi:MAG: hypothetical protein K0S08_2071 [Gammaproteobacteria bacterium]|jgi:hypothetical protein|nr:hypothetical protein [Gammaproteobacteria bacterium]
MIKNQTSIECIPNDVLAIIGEKAVKKDPNLVRALPLVSKRWKSIFADSTGDPVYLEKAKIANLKWKLAQLKHANEILKREIELSAHTPFSPTYRQILLFLISGGIMLSSSMLLSYLFNRITGMDILPVSPSEYKRSPLSIYYSGLNATGMLILFSRLTKAFPNAAKDSIDIAREKKIKIEQQIKQTQDRLENTEAHSQIDNADEQQVQQVQQTQFNL